MSWHAYTVALPKQVRALVNGLEPEGKLTQPEAAQLKAAKAAAIAIVTSGAVGEGEAFQISLSGTAHANNRAPDGQPADVVAVVVSQTTAHKAFHARGREDE